MITSIAFTVLSYFGCLSFLLVLGWYLYVQKFSKYLKNIPGPTPLPILGNALMFKDSNKTLQNLTKVINDYGKIGRVWIGINLVILLADYKSIETVLSSSKLLDKSGMYRFLHSWLGTGLLTSPAPKWNQRRKLLAPSFHLHVLEQFVPTFNKVATNLIKELQNIKNKNCLDIYPLISLATLDVICETAMGVSVNALQNKDSSYVHSVKEMGRIVMERVVSPLQQLDVLFSCTQNGKIQRDSLKILHEHTMSVIQKRRQELAKQSTENVDLIIDEVGTKKQITFLDMLLQYTDNGKPMSDDDIREEVDTFMYKGHDSAASGICFTLFEIANNAIVQDKILAEQKAIFGMDGRDPTYQDIASMKYLEMVIKEGLRMYPPIPVFDRTVQDDIRITDDVWCPKGSTIAVLAYHIQRDPEFFPEPDTFNPDRFSVDSRTEKYLFSYLPFSAGPRNCIGEKFAFLELKSMISKIVRNFHLEPVVPAHRLELVVETTLKSRNSILIKVDERFETTHL